MSYGTSGTVKHILVVTYFLAFIKLYSFLIFHKKIKNEILMTNAN